VEYLYYGEESSSANATNATEVRGGETVPMATAIAAGPALRRDPGEQALSSIGVVTNISALGQGNVTVTVSLL
jgi:hypothetical protein